jgi:hypothetical protein
MISQKIDEMGRIHGRGQGMRLKGEKRISKGVSINKCKHHREGQLSPDAKLSKIHPDPKAKNMGTSVDAQTERCSTWKKKGAEASLHTSR